MENIDLYLLHCDEHSDQARIKHINLIKEKLLPYNLTFFKGYHSKENSLDGNNQLEYLKTHDPNINFFNEWRFYKPGQIGCYLSHHMLIKNISNNEFNKKYSLIFEDDVYFRDTFRNTFKDKVNKIIKNIENNNIYFDIIYLGNLNNNKGIHIHDNIYKLDNSKYCWGAHALLINNSKAKKIYELNCSIKHEIDNHYKFLCDENKLVVLTIYPVIAYQNKMLPSNIS